MAGDPEFVPAICPKCFVPMKRVKMEQDLYVVLEEFQGRMELVVAGALVCPLCNCLAAVAIGD